MRIAVTADLHWGHNSAGDQATTLLAQHLRDGAPDLLLLGGDLGTAKNFEACLELFRALPCPKAVIPGNHDLWVEQDDPRGDSLQVYQKLLPALCAVLGFHYLDHGPLNLPGRDVAVVGAINWYDYSWAIERLQAEVPDWEWRLRHMAFTRGRHNDRRFVRWPCDDVAFTAQVVAAFEQHLAAALDLAPQALVMTHHPAFYGISFPRSGPPSVPDGLLWDAFAGNRTLESVLTRHADRIPFIFSGHTHRACESQLGPSRGINVGGDYHFKRLIELDWPAGTITAHQFGTA